MKNLSEIIRERLMDAVGVRGQIKLEAQESELKSIQSGEDVPLEARLKEFAALQSLANLVDELATEIKDAKTALEPGILEDMAAAGMQRSTVGGFTLFAKRDRYVNKFSGMSQAEMCDVLRENGLGWLVAEGYNAQKLKGWVCEKLDQAREALPADEREMTALEDLLQSIPEGLRSSINVGEAVRLAANKAS